MTVPVMTTSCKPPRASPARLHPLASAQQTHANIPALGIISPGFDLLPSVVVLEKNLGEQSGRLCRQLEKCTAAC